MKWDQEATDQLLDAFERFSRDIDRQQEKYMQKLYQPIEENATYQSLLLKLTKSELTDIRQFWNYTGISTLKKAELAKELDRRVPGSLQTWLVCLDQGRVKFLKHLIANDGVIEDPGMEMDELLYYRRRGVIFSGKIDDRDVLVMPQELVLPVQKLLSQPDVCVQLKQTDELFYVTKGLLVYYGVISTIHLHEMVQSITGKEIPMYNFIHYLEDWLDFDRDLVRREGFIQHGAVEDRDWVVNEQQFRDQLPYYPLTKQQALTAGRKNTFETNLVQKKFVKYLLANYDGVSPDLAEFILQEMMFTINNNQGANMQVEYEFLQQFISFESLEQMQELSGYVMELHNNTPQWVLKGHAPNQIASPEPTHNFKKPGRYSEEVEEKPQPIVKGKKIGRNEPCPCGSGKKYKKCCGR